MNARELESRLENYLAVRRRSDTGTTFCAACCRILFGMSSQGISMGPFEPELLLTGLAPRPGVTEPPDWPTA
jgi:hypothetical protein